MRKIEYVYPDDFLDKKLNERVNANALRSLKLPSGKIDLCSNDYLGIVRNGLLSVDHTLRSGSTGSRLLAGNYQLIEETEKEIAAFHETDAALIFNSGYDANVGLLSCVPQRGDTVLYDYLSHASIRAGIRLSLADSFSFAHNNMLDLEEKLKRAKGKIFIVTESVFSMDGDVCSLADLVILSEKYGAHLIIDEAHATGLTGKRGEGLVQSLSFQNKIFARVHTFGKALGCHGAAVVGSQKLRTYLINFAGSLIYSTALPEQAIAVIAASYKCFPMLDKEREILNRLIHLFSSAQLRFEKIRSETPIQAVIIPGNEAVRTEAEKLQAEGFDVRPILYPTVPLGAERIRIVLHSFNTENEVRRLISLLS